ncbi:hypothetical protein FHR47_001064 [Xanthomonas arboricola]|uniref:hypothetical protein n=1 Tax=Xanthomonas cannabis TaxID=1885674 RepID=UPI00160E901C|nr:hypothetical protein [Xanthomonas cannabis]MBB3800830.1 hypothetical protein [Xanthomonas cannabis]
MATAEKKATTTELPVCFLIMPIADPDGYEKGHFTRVYEDVFKPACQKSGYQSVRADEVKQTNLIHLDILQKLIESPMAVCDLSSRNPNVLFELGLRQAFDMPTVLVQEIGTPKIFDIAPLRYTEYRSQLGYRDVLEDQEQIAEAIRSTATAAKSGKSVNSIVKILSLSRPAALQDASENDIGEVLQIVRAEINELRSEFRRTTSRMTGVAESAITGIPTPRIRNFEPDIEQVMHSLKHGMPPEMALEEITKIKKNILRRMEPDVTSSVREKAYDYLMKCEAAEAEIYSKFGRSSE